MPGRNTTVFFFLHGLRAVVQVPKRAVLYWQKTFWSWCSSIYKMQNLFMLGDETSFDAETRKHLFSMGNLLGSSSMFGFGLGSQLTDNDDEFDGSFNTLFPSSRNQFYWSSRVLIILCTLFVGSTKAADAEDFADIDDSEALPEEEEEPKPFFTDSQQLQQPFTSPPSIGPTTPLHYGAPTSIGNNHVAASPRGSMSYNINNLAQLNSTPINIVNISKIEPPATPTTSATPETPKIQSLHSSSNIYKLKEEPSADTASSTASTSLASSTAASSSTPLASSSSATQPPVSVHISPTILALLSGEVKDSSAAVRQVCSTLKGETGPILKFSEIFAPDSKVRPLRASSSAKQQHLKDDNADQPSSSTAPGTVDKLMIHFN